MKTDPPHILCVNPWVHDFAAFDFWARPLGLLTIAAILRQNRVRVSFLDCMNRFHPRKTNRVKVYWDGRGPFDKTPIPLPQVLDPHLGHIRKQFTRYGALKAWIEQDLPAMDRPDLILVTSLMTYWATGVAETIALLKKRFPGVPVVLGGIYATLCETHARKYSGADHVVTGPAEPVLADLVETYTGFSLTHIPDPADLDTTPFAALDLQGIMAYAPILTSRGCPFSCEYCASSFLEPRFRRRSPENVFQEICHWHNNFQVKNFAFYDDALLIQPEKYAFPLLERIIDEKMDLFFHTPNAVHIKEISAKAADLMFKADFKTIRLGLETADFSSHRHDIKVKRDEFLMAVDHLRTAGFAKDQLGAYLLCGLPGQNLDEVEGSITLVKRLGLTPVPAYYTPIPHTPMWADAVKHARFDITAHPALTNNSLFPCVRSQKDLARISQLKKMVK
ncbi:B12-binding domain-containing radical SAM protein [Desulfobacter latus]|uniref:B12-binding domain-containing radical SAM protein n=1 Tax=Desulfobacter latus TaxID=2292 RepID=A0A850T9L7_9BACT|nr:radical SAM protein [Desulfobacter latus]NWH04056.1 B12-binding domain-containing radical SAM protein [Desulfobacter latus]